MTEPVSGSAPAAPGRMERWRARADAAAQRYQRRAQAQPLLGLPLAFLARYTARQGVLLASAAAFRLFLWLLPLALLTAGLLAGLTQNGTSGVEAAGKTAGLTGEARDQVVTALQDGRRSWVVAVITGAVLFLWATRTLMRNLTVVNAHAWAAPVPKMRQKQVLLTTLLFAGAWLLMFSFAAGIHRLSQLVPLGVLVAIVLEGLAVGAVWLLISSRLPDRRRVWTDLLPGAVIMGAGLAILNTVGRIYLPTRFAHASAMYGSLGIASVMLLWLLFIGQLIVSAALANAVWLEFRDDRNGVVNTAPVQARSQQLGAL